MGPQHIAAENIAFNMAELRLHVLQWGRSTSLRKTAGCACANFGE